MYVHSSFFSPPLCKEVLKRDVNTQQFWWGFGCIKIEQKFRKASAVCPIYFFPSAHESTESMQGGLREYKSEHVSGT